MKRVTRALLAQETLKNIEAGGYRNPAGKWVDLRQAIRNCVDLTRLYLPEELRALELRALELRALELRALELLDAASARKAEIEVTTESTLEAVRRLSRDGGHVVVLNFASARNPGGGFLNGSQAQEETLARSSGLHPSLMRCPEFYDHHRAAENSLYTHRMIVSPGCPVFRNDEGNFLERPDPATFITSPAPNAGALISKNQPDRVRQIPVVLRERALLLFKLASQVRADTLVLGAWGCGVFQNDPSDVALAFAELLDPQGPLRWSFQRVVFAIYDRSPGRLVLDAFRERLNGVYLCHT